MYRSQPRPSCWSILTLLCVALCLVACQLNVSNSAPVGLPAGNSSPQPSALPAAQPAVLNQQSKLTCVVQAIQAGQVEGNVNIRKDCETIVSPNEVVFESAAAKDLTLIAHDLLAQNRCADSQLLYQRAYELESGLTAKGYLSSRLDNTRQCQQNKLRFEPLQPEPAPVQSAGTLLATAPATFGEGGLPEPVSGSSLPDPQATAAGSEYSEMGDESSPSVSSSTEPSVVPSFEPSPSASPSTEPSMEPSLEPTAQATPTVTPSPTATPRLDAGTLKWQKDPRQLFPTASSAHFSNPVLLNDQKLVLGVSANLGTSQSSKMEYYLLSLDFNGQEIWRYKLSSLPPEDPVIGVSGTIYLNYIDSITALYPDGQLKWTYKKPGAKYGVSKLAVDAQENLYTLYRREQTVQGVTIASNILLSITKDRQQRWLYTYPGYCSSVSEISLGHGNQLYLNLASCDETSAALHAFNTETGQSVWFFELQSILTRLDVTLGNQHVYVYDAGLKRLYALNPVNGSERWRVVDLNFLGGFAIDAQENLYVGRFRIQPDGRYQLLPNDHKWTAQIDGSGTSQSVPLIGADGMVYYHCCSGGVNRGGISAIRPNDASLAWSYPGSGSSPPILASNGMLFFVADSSSDKALIALQTSSAGLALSSWPRTRGDNRNSGQVP